MFVPCGVPGIQGDETDTLCSLQELSLWGGGVLSGETENESRQERILTSRAQVSESGRLCVCVCSCARTRVPVIGETVVLEHPLSQILSVPQSQDKQLWILPWRGERPSLQPVLNPRGLGPASNSHLPCKSSSGGDGGVAVSTQDPAAPHVLSEDLPPELRLSQFPKEMLSLGTL